MTPTGIEHIVGLFPWLLLGATLLGWLAIQVRVPYASMLVLGGLVVASTRLVPVPHLDPDLLLFAFLPPLLFGAAFRLDVREIRVVARPMLLLAIPGTVLTAALVAACLAAVLQLPLALGLLFGCIVAATDPVAVVGVFRRLHAPRHLSVIAEGESLVNDGVAITLYTAFLALAVSGGATAIDVSELFVRQVIGGVALGAFLGLVALALTSVIDDHLLEMTLSTALAYGSFLAAQSGGFSGALACVVAGLIHGSLGRGAGMSAENRRLLDDLWEYLGFLANAIVFLLLGLSVDLESLVPRGWAIVAAVVAVLLTRLVTLQALRAIPGGSLVRTPAERLVLAWGGLRGALTAALALALPPATPERDLLIAMAFGVVLFSLIVQGTTLSPLLRRVGLVRTP